MKCSVCGSSDCQFVLIEDFAQGVPQLLISAWHAELANTPRAQFACCKLDASVLLWRWLGKQEGRLRPVEVSA